MKKLLIAVVILFVSLQAKMIVVENDIGDDLRGLYGMSDTDKFLSMFESSAVIEIHGSLPSFNLYIKLKDADFIIISCFDIKSYNAKFQFIKNALAAK
jgi:hypothetical protein